MKMWEKTAIQCFFCETTHKTHTIYLLNFQNLPIVIIVAVVSFNPVIFWASYFWRAKCAALVNFLSAQYISPAKGHQLSDPWWILNNVRKAFCIAMKMRWTRQFHQYPHMYLSFKSASLYFRSWLILVHPNTLESSWWVRSYVRAKTSCNWV